MSSPVLHVACAADEGYAAHSAAMLHSVLAHAGDEDVHVHYLHGSALSAESRRRIGEMVERAGGEISFLAIADDEVAGLPVRTQFTPAIWYRTFLPERLPDVDRILYLDADVLVVDSLAPLRDFELAGSYVGAVTNVFMRHQVYRPTALGLSPQHPYFNSGVLLLNLDLLRRDGCTRALLAFAREHGEALEWPDQDALNVVLGPRRLPLAPRWNAMNSVLRFPWSVDVLGAVAVAEARARPAIRHFEGPSLNKPWHYLAGGADRALYAAHRRETAWPDVALEGATLGNRVKRLARGRRGRGRGVSA